MKKMLLAVLVILMFVSGAFGQRYVCRHMRWSVMLGRYIPENCRWSPIAGGYIHRSARYTLLAPAYCHPCCCQYDYYCCWPVIRKVDCILPLEIVSSGPSPSHSVKIVKKPTEQRERDGLWTVYYYLKGKGLEVDLADSFCCGNQTINAVLLIKSKKLLIKYRNLEGEKSLAKNPVRQECYQKFREKWSVKEKEYEALGWKIAQIFG